MSIVSLLLLIFILGVIILVHELGHFLWAKKFGVFIYEFSLGMGPIIYSKTAKDGIKYNIRLIPIGGFVSLAGEVYENDEEIPKERFLCNKKWHQRIIILVAGVINNFILAIIIFFISTLIWGASIVTTNIKNIKPDYPFEIAGIEKGDKITKINGIKIKNWDSAQLVLYMKNKNNYYEFEILTKDKEIKTYKIVPKEEKVDKETVKTFGVELKVKQIKGFIPSIKFAFTKFGNVMDSMYLTIHGLLTGKISLKSMSGPVGMYQVVDSAKTYGIANMLYLVAFLSVNVGFINILPFPAFDGGRILFLLIEKIRRKPINVKLENAFHVVGFALLILLMVYVSIQDIIKLF